VLVIRYLGNIVWKGPENLTFSSYALIGDNFAVQDAETGCSKCDKRVSKSGK
jgi:hypothetical protein